ncbi:helix-turn-helix domain-containing protein [Tamlana fucoidanivorans]|uniref:Helix-turn-helix domain-containing protein n=1 Tax=Allotamlana fucoidanivorans TaxID=2583814 RepID=A0A5C4SHB3_9FLAO|nr:helix-turn-helix domain-containing protein [Tamlana fucoidanivorans]TNJ42981.1 helix-turn-helix domain-containing protein [Tamlana fucoidanivorans]
MNQDKEFIHKLKQIVLNNLTNEQFSVEHLSEIAGISRSHLHRRLKKLKGISISQFIREIRLDEALKLLQENTATISEIAYQVGFNSTSYFNKCFHDRYGYAPSEAKKIIIETTEQKLLTKRFNIQQIKPHRTIYNVVAIVFMLVLGGWSLYYFSPKKETSTTTEKSIAILPFKNLSNDENNQYFADGLMEDLLNRLATINNLKVISRTSSETYRDKTSKKIPTIASELGVTHILEGSVRKSNNKVRITVQLIDAMRDDHIWMKTFDKDLADIFKIQSEIALQISSDLSTVLTKQQTDIIKKNPTENIKAFEFYQLGRYYWGKRLWKDYKTAANYFNKAIAEDSTYALAYAGLGDTYFLKIWETSDSTEMRENRNKAETYALKALELEPRLAEAHTVLATLYFFIDWDWANAQTSFSNALEFNNNYSTLHHRYAEFLSYIDKDDEARKHINKALEIDPLSYIVREVSAKLYLFRGNYPQSLIDSKIGEDLNKEKIRPLLYQFWANYALKNDEEVLDYIKKINLKLLTNKIPEDDLNLIYHKSGRDGLMLWLATSLEQSLPKAHCYTFLNEQEKAMNLLEDAFNKGDRLGDAPYRYFATQLESNSRFIVLMEKMNLPWVSNN